MKPKLLKLLGFPPKSLRIAALSLCFTFSLAKPSVFATDSVTIDFARDILPILSDHCFQCHGPDAEGGREADLRLDDHEDLLRSRGDYSIVVPEAPEASELFRRVSTEDDSEIMPPPELDRALSAEQVDMLRRWIAEGARWGKHWAFEPPLRAQNLTSSQHPIDELLDRVFEREEITPNPRADRETLIRRLSLDLTGLPPNPRDVEDFMADKDPSAWETLVRKNLASPAFGERMAWDWLEAARYADSNGYQGDRERTMWPWRDWVVRAFNENMAFDDFTLWQLAGDLLPNASEEQILATGFLRNHMINGEGGRIAEENRVDYVMDMTETTGTVWLGLTLNCCRCHDHKFDPLQQKEYYQLTAFFNQTPVTGTGGDPQTAPTIAYPDAQQRKTQQRIRQRLDDLAAEKKSLTEQLLKTEYAAWETAQRDRNSPDSWTALNPAKAEAQGQTLEIDAQSHILASGPNPANDGYKIQFEIDTAAAPIRSIALQALRHPSMTNGGLARSDSGNFVLTDIHLRYSPDETESAKWPNIEIASATASFEQGGHKIEQAFDDNPKTGWAVYRGKPVESDHTAVFTLEQPVPTSAKYLEIELEFRSPHKHHNLGYFAFQANASPAADFSPVPRTMLDALHTEADARTPTQQANLREAFLESRPEIQSLQAKIDGQQSAIKRLQSQIPKVMVMRDQEQPRRTFMLNRGLYNQPGDPVDAFTPQALHAFRPADKAAATRLDLARWIIARDNPLTARVVVNRYWQMLFGVGLVKTTEDFGVQGEYPIQKELLDWLAVEFIESGWDLKHLLTVILTSEAYRRDSGITAETWERDPENRLLARGPRFRLPSWMLRDQALAISGLLNHQTGGAPVKPYQPEGIWSEATFGKKTYQTGTGEELYRRSLYTFWRRIIGPTMFFDAAKRQVCEVKPVRTNTPMHALNMLNDTTYVEAARVLAQQVISQDDLEDDTAKLQWLAQRALNRSFHKAELTVWIRSLAAARTHYAHHPEDAQQILAVGQSATLPDQDAAEAAAWTGVCSNLLNLDEVLTKE